MAAIGALPEIGAVNMPALLQTQSAHGQSFDEIFEAAANVLKDINTLQIKADQAQIDLASGRTDDILAVMLAQEKAYSALNFSVQATNKIIESYREIMRMQL
ncbi:MAG: flagellar hook-basal body complex protein FliE [Clostridiales bacterium]|nr:flagellar hook-basal body complex protein FliE [Clostridiales bacterium]